MMYGRAFSPYARIFLTTLGSIMSAVLFGIAGAYALIGYQFLKILTSMTESKKALRATRVCFNIYYY
jgi:hypothetical protein